jgi:hypothetical protein
MVLNDRDLVVGDRLLADRPEWLAPDGLQDHQDGLIAVVGVQAVRLL